MGLFMDIVGSVTGMPSVEQISAGATIDPDVLRRAASEPNITNERAGEVLDALLVMINKSLYLSQPKFLGDPGLPDIKTKENIRDRVIALRKVATAGYPQTGVYPMQADLMSVADAVGSNLEAAEDSIPRREQIVEQLGTDIKQNAENAVDIGSKVLIWTVVIGGLVIGYFIYREIKK